MRFKGRDAAVPPFDAGGIGICPLVLWAWGVHWSHSFMWFLKEEVFFHVRSRVAWWFRPACTARGLAVSKDCLISAQGHGCQRGRRRRAQQGPRGQVQGAGEGQGIQGAGEYTAIL